MLFVPGEGVRTRYIENELTKVRVDIRYRLEASTEFQEIASPYSMGYGEARNTSQMF